mgnify:FL=1
MKPALQLNSRTLAYASLLLILTISSGCSLTDRIPGSKQLKELIPGGEEEKSADLTVGDLTVPNGMNYLKVESIGLVNGLTNTGSTPPSGMHRQMLIDEMQTHDVENPNALLSSPRTSLVLLRGYLPPGVRKGDPFDVEVRVPTHSKTESLRDGYLLRSRMRELAVLNQNVRTGHVAALSEGSVLEHSLFRGQDDNTNNRSGIVLGGGVSHMDRPLGLLVKTKFSSIRTATRIASAINRRFLQYTDDNSKGVATAKSDNYVELVVHDSYRHNVSRYMNVIRSIVVGESDIASHERKELLLAKLLEPTTAAEAAMQLEAIGAESIPTLRQGLSSEDPEVQFYAAESLAYLDEPDAAPALSQLASQHIAFRWHAMTALAGMDHVNALDAITELLNAESAETRVGAFRALWTRNPDSPLVNGRTFNDFHFHQVDSTAYSLVHIAMSKRPEMVAFGKDIQVTPTDHVFAGKEIIIKNKGDGQLQISRFSPNRPDRFATCTTHLADVIRAIAEVDGNYSDVVDMLQTLKKTNAINARVLIGARPRPIWSFNRDSNSEPSGEAGNYEVSNPIPEMYFDRLAETEAEAVKRNHSRVESDSSTERDESPEPDGFMDKVKSAIPGL